jgi:hypothetical protein
MKEASIKLKIARKIVERIKLVVQTHFSGLNVPYAITTNIDENTSQTIADIV